jgi:hypothetical protein
MRHTGLPSGTYSVVHSILHLQDLNDTLPGALPVSLSLAADREPDTRSGVPPSRLVGTLHAEQLVPGTP